MTVMVGLFLFFITNDKPKKQTKKKVYLLDSLSDLQKEIFFEYYCGYVGGGGTYYSQLYCNDNVYRQEYRIGDKLVLIGK